MLTHKIFHLHQSVDEAREQLRDPGTWDGTEIDPEVRCSRSETDGIGHLEWRRQGQLLSADIEEVPGDEPNRILFRSVGGSVELAGMVELFPIRPNLTEAILTVEYEAVSPLFKALDAMSTAVDTFLNQQLSRLEGCLTRKAAPVAKALSGRLA